jgi:hypothetical protein
MGHPLPPFRPQYWGEGVALEDVLLLKDGGGDGLFHKMVEPNDRRDKDGGGGRSHHLDGVFDPFAFAGKQQHHCPSSAADLQRFEGLVHDEHAS